jgi:hypothetical protein
MKLLVVNFLASRYFLSGAKDSPQHTVLKQPQSAIFAVGKRQCSIPIKERSKIAFSYI